MLMKSGIGRTDDKTKVIDHLPVNFDSGFLNTSQHKSVNRSYMGGGEYCIDGSQQV
jgi:hypothetical protein